jgi:tetratricopeptide (TPR) repeat protein
VEDEFVVCPSCGTRIKAGREFCLRCFGPLPTAERPIRPPIWVSFGLSESKLQIVGVVIAAIVIGLGVVIYKTEPPDVDDTARPISATPAARPGAPPVTPPPETAAAPPSESTASPVGFFNPIVSAGPMMLPSDVAALDAKRAQFESDLAKSPDDVGLINDLAVALDRLGRPADAVPRFERALALAPNQARIHSNLAHALSALGLWDRAILEYREAARLKKDDYIAQLTLGKTLHQKGDDQAAVEELQTATKMSPNEAEAHLWYGVGLERVGRRDDAIQEFRRFLALQPSAPDSDRLRAHLQDLGVDKP